MTKQPDELQNDTDKCNALLAALENWHGPKSEAFQLRGKKRHDLFLALMAFRRE